MRKHIIKYKEQMSSGQYFNAHETLEELWFPRRKEKSKDVLILKGFINAAVSLELKKRGRYDNHKKIWLVYKKFSALIEAEDSEFVDLKKFVDCFEE